MVFERTLAERRVEYESEYRLVSAVCIPFHFPATSLRTGCRHFRSAAFTCARVVETFNPKVVGSIPTRPIKA
jgi:hypothetical protein